MVKSCEIILNADYGLRVILILSTNINSNTYYNI